MNKMNEVFSIQMVSATAIISSRADENYLFNLVGSHLSVQDQTSVVLLRKIKVNSWRHEDHVHKIAQRK